MNWLQFLLIWVYFSLIHLIFWLVYSKGNRFISINFMGKRNPFNHRSKTSEKLLLITDLKGQIGNWPLMKFIVLVMPSCWMLPIDNFFFKIFFITTWPLSHGRNCIIKLTQTKLCLHGLIREFSKLSSTSAGKNLDIILNYKNLKFLSSEPL